MRVWSFSALILKKKETILINLDDRYTFDYDSEGSIIKRRKSDVLVVPVDALKCFTCLDKHFLHTTTFRVVSQRDAVDIELGQVRVRELGLVRDAVARYPAAALLLGARESVYSQQHNTKLSDMFRHTTHVLISG